MRLLQQLKNQVVTPGTRARRIRSGALKGQLMNLDLTHDTQVYLGLYERELHPSLRRFAGNAVNVVDAGAADGAYSLYFLQRPHVRAVYAFEPDPIMRELLVQNLELNGFADDMRMRVIDAPLGDHGTSLDESYSAIQFPLFVKVDVEGHEVAVLEGARRLLERGDSSWLIETHSLKLETDCIRLLRSHGLRVEIVEPAWWRFALPELRPIGHNRWLVAHKESRGAR